MGTGDWGGMVHGGGEGAWLMVGVMGEGGCGWRGDGKWG